MRRWCSRRTTPPAGARSWSATCTRPSTPTRCDAKGFVRHSYMVTYVAGWRCASSSSGMVPEVVMLSCRKICCTECSLFCSTQSIWPESRKFNINGRACLSPETDAVPLDNAAEAAIWVLRERAQVRAGGQPAAAGARGVLHARGALLPLRSVACLLRCSPCQRASPISCISSYLCAHMNHCWVTDNP